MHSRPLLRTRWPSWTTTTRQRPHPRSFSASIQVTDTLRVDEADKVKLRRPLAEVFEEPSADYDGTHFPPAPPSVLQQIQQLPPVLPAHVDGASIFEDESEEYRLQTPSTAYPSNFSAATLESLLSEERFGTAYSLLCEMQHVNSPIPPSPLYETAAFFALRSTSLSAADKLLQFMQWFSLIPPIHLTSRRGFSELRFLLLQAPSAHLALLERTVLILASKGYSGQAIRPFLAPLFTYLPPSRLHSLITNIESRDTEYWTTHLPSEAPLRIQQTCETVRGIAVRCLIYNNHVDQALSFCLGPNAPKSGFPVQIHDVVLHKLHMTPTQRFKAHIPSIQALRDARLTFESTSSSTPTTLTPTPFFPSSSSSTLFPPPLPAPPPRAALAHTLRYLRTHLSHPDPHRKLPSLLTQFIADYIKHTHGRTHAVQQLLSLALRRGSQKQLKNIVFAEMRVYRMLGRPEMVVRAFVEHFYLTGVPEAEVMRCYEWVLDKEKERNKETVGRRSKTRNVGETRRITGYERDTLLPRGKMWPDLEQCALVWEALVLQIMRADRKRRDKAMSILKLYEKFLETGRERSEDFSSSSSSSSFNTSINTNNIGTNDNNNTNTTNAGAGAPTRFARPISSPTFHTFMHHLIPLLGPAIGHLIMHDMKFMSLHPSIYHYTTLARGWAEFSGSSSDGGGGGMRGGGRGRRADTEEREVEIEREGEDAGEGSAFTAIRERRARERREKEAVVWAIVDALERGEEPVLDVERIGAGESAGMVRELRRIWRHHSALEVLDLSRLGDSHAGTNTTTTTDATINTIAATDATSSTTANTTTAATTATLHPGESTPALVPVPKLDRAFYIALMQGFLYASNDDAAEEAMRRFVVRFERSDAPPSPLSRVENHGSSPGISSSSSSSSPSTAAEDQNRDPEEDAREDAQMGTLEELAVYPPLVRAGKKLRDLRAMKERERERRGMGMVTV